MLPPLFMIAAVQSQGEECSDVTLKTGKVVRVQVPADTVASTVHKCTMIVLIIQQCM